MAFIGVGRYAASTEDLTMIRLPDLPNTALWARPPLSLPRVDTQRASNWFHDDAADSGAYISSDVNLAARSLSVEQHAMRVLGCLCVEAGERV